MCCSSWTLLYFQPAWSRLLEYSFTSDSPWILHSFLFSRIASSCSWAQVSVGLMETLIFRCLSYKFQLIFWWFRVECDSKLSALRSSTSDNTVILRRLRHSAEPRSLLDSIGMTQRTQSVLSGVKVEPCVTFTSDKPELLGDTRLLKKKWAQLVGLVKHSLSGFHIPEH